MRCTADCMMTAEAEGDSVKTVDAIYEAQNVKLSVKCETRFHRGEK